MRIWNNQNSHTLLVGVSLGHTGSVCKVEHIVFYLNTTERLALSRLIWDFLSSELYENKFLLI